jgi:cellulose 1,4-beta-cellobiosidase
MYKVAAATGNSITDSFCGKQKTAFGDNNAFAQLGGLNAMGASLARGHVLVMSLWDDHAVNMLWLDSTYPTTADPSKPGIARGTCSTSSGKPEDLEKNSPNSSVVFSNIRFGPIGSTFNQAAAAKRTVEFKA